MSARTPEVHSGSIEIRRPGPVADRTAEQLAADIRETRTRLTATVDALVARTDVRARARLAAERRWRDVRESVRRMMGRMRAALQAGSRRG
ncbi:DUF3618 domain-containing protein [Actinospica sp. MGRD01-02]|uniref:DUF3618 domain-containing protein n=1 Tax=Actinospica acidithermotolerans TaxID=2828514 RepID=A0A941EI15_9ACTN|nr:DUF3618 domain-containing protein [Actinospica acidithermotolerans]MBR7828019.1 DUF3618 domain-containing protein [Actinospica acidithermotolerans]